MITIIIIGISNID